MSKLRAFCLANLCTPIHVALLWGKIVIKKKTWRKSTIIYKYTQLSLFNLFVPRKKDLTMNKLYTETCKKVLLLWVFGFSLNNYFTYNLFVPAKKHLTLKKLYTRTITVRLLHTEFKQSNFLENTTQSKSNRDNFSRVLLVKYAR